VERTNAMIEEIKRRKEMIALVGYWNWNEKKNLEKIRLQQKSRAEGHYLDKAFRGKRWKILKAEASLQVDSMRLGLG